MVLLTFADGSVDDFELHEGCEASLGKPYISCERRGMVMPLESLSAQGLVCPGHQFYGSNCKYFVNTPKSECGAKSSKTDEGGVTTIKVCSNPVSFQPYCAKHFAVFQRLNGHVVNCCSIECFNYFNKLQDSSLSVEDLIEFDNHHPSVITITTFPSPSPPGVRSSTQSQASTRSQSTDQEWVPDLCNGICQTGARAGERCSKKKKQGSDYCHMHQGQRGKKPTEQKKKQCLPPEDMMAMFNKFMSAYDGEESEGGGDEPQMKELNEHFTSIARMFDSSSNKRLQQKCDEQQEELLRRDRIDLWKRQVREEQKIMV